jgi:hypothetical protein
MEVIEHLRVQNLSKDELLSRTVKDFQEKEKTVFKEKNDKEWELENQVEGIFFPHWTIPDR